MTVSNALFIEAQVIKDTNSALEDIQETLALSLVDSLKAGDHITTPTVINMLKDLEDMQLKYYDRLEDNENTQGALENQEKPFYEDDKDETPDEDKDEIAEGWKKFEKEHVWTDEDKETFTLSQANVIIEDDEEEQSGDEETAE
ncbi:hypothetical protein NE282_10140 [Leuconostoc mesenteroides]|uniref:hypothetical protein n=1 Tax=Leuconostoc mesenteroides TaxID=1245 RepID=UPI0020737D12|nr:hypothetical protein [Leuconostoc mesenteroides]MCM6834236.1 hypothetical protein [Leuconostoc mesenteroides]